MSINKEETCQCCLSVKEEKTMLYVVSIDKYFCNQMCFDAYNEEAEQDE